MIPCHDEEGKKIYSTGKKEDDGDRAFEVFMIDKMNKEAESGDSYDEFQENDDDEGSEYYLDNEE